MSAEFDVFLSHNSEDKPTVEGIASRLKARGVSVWLDSWQLRPGHRWQREIEAAIEGCRAIAVFVGASGVGPWEAPEVEAFLDRAMREADLAVIPVLLPGAPKKVELPQLLRLYTWVDLREGVTDARIDRLVWGIRGDAKKPVKTTRPRRWRPLQLGTMLAVLGLLATLAAWFWPRPPAPSGPLLPSLYALRVQAIDPEGRPAAISAVKVSAGNEPQKLADGWWEVEIPAMKLPENRTVSVFVESEGWESGRADLTLGEDPNPRAEIRLRQPVSWLRGRVLDHEGRPLAGARIIPLSVAAADSATDSSGLFELRLPVTPDTRVRVRAESEGSVSEETFCYSGRDRCTIELEAT